MLQSFCISLSKLGFEFHHAKKDFVMMTKWLPNEPNTLPNYAHHFVGERMLSVCLNRTVPGDSYPLIPKS